MKMTAKLTGFELDLQAYRTTLAASMTDQLKDSIRVWLNAVIKPTIPTWSGASRATFEKIAKLAGLSMTYGPQKSRKDRKPLGKRESTASLKSTKAGVYSFEWGTTLRYFILNETTRQEYVPGARDTGSGVIYSRSGLTHPGPYNLESKGATVLEAFAQEITVPSLSPYIKTKSVKI